MTHSARETPSGPILQGRTFVGYAPAPAPEAVGAGHCPDDVGAIEDLLTELTPIGGGARVSGGPGREAALSMSMLDELRRTLRAAERRERETGRSGVHLRSEASREPVEIEVEVEVAPLPEEAEEALGELPELEVALAPRSESTLYGGFDADPAEGVFIATYERLPVGSALFVRVHLPGGHGFRTPATVEFVREPEAEQPGLPVGMGVRLKGLDARMRGLLKTFARFRTPMFWG